MSKKGKNIVVASTEFMFFWVVYEFIRLVPINLAYAFSRKICRLWYYIDSRHRHRVISHLVHSGIVQESNVTGLAGKNYVHYSKLLVEMFKNDQILDASNVRELVKISGDKRSIEILFSETNPQQVIIVTAHYGNWEVAAKMYTLLSGKKLVSVKRLMKNRLIGKYIFKHREVENHEGVPKKGALRPLLKALRNSNSVAILADQHASSTEGCENTFFGQPARTHFSPALLHLRTGVPIVPVVIKRLEDEPPYKFEIAMDKPIYYQSTENKEEDLRNISQKYTSYFEKMIRQEPSQWMWMHRRWLNINRRKRKKIK